MLVANYLKQINVVEVAYPINNCSVKIISSVTFSVHAPHNIEDENIHLFIKDYSFLGKLGD